MLVGVCSHSMSLILIMTWLTWRVILLINIVSYLTLYTIFVPSISIFCFLNFVFVLLLTCNKDK